MEVKRPPHGAYQPLQASMIHVKVPKVNLHPWITSVLSLNGWRWEHMDPWAHMRSKPMWQVKNKHHTHSMTCGTCF
jgi:hypothetical protein